MRHLTIKRRGVLLAFAAALIPGVGVRWARAGMPKTAAEVVFSDLDAARAIGARYLSETVHECHATFLIERLPFGCEAPPASARAIDRLRAAIDAQRANDFAVGDTVIVDGWILARTEARLCALAALTVA